MRCKDEKADEEETAAAAADDKQDILGTHGRLNQSNSNKILYKSIYIFK